jgi:hypothetical protein
VGALGKAGIIRRARRHLDDARAAMVYPCKL